jgi:hypothetical protein
MIGLSSLDSPGHWRDQWSGLFGFGPKPVQLFGIGSGVLRDEDPLEKIQPPEDSTSSSGALRTNPYNCSCSSKPPGTSYSFQKKNKKSVFLLLTRVAMVAIYNSRVRQGLG